MTNIRCAYCLGDLETGLECPSCHTLVHADCAQEGCPTLGCGERLVAFPQPKPTSETHEVGGAIWPGWKRALLALAVILGALWVGEELQLAGWPKTALSLSAIALATGVTFVGVKRREVGGDGERLAQPEKKENEQPEPPTRERA